MKEQILNYIKKENLLKNPRITDDIANEKYKNKEIKFIIEGEIDINNITMEIACDKHFPLHKPYCYIKSSISLPMIPHVDKRGQVCYVEDEGLLIDTSDERLIIRDTILKALSTIRTGIEGLNKIDFMNEFESYWLGQDNILICESMIELTHNVKEVVIAFFESYKTMFFGDDVGQIMKYCNKYIGNGIRNKPLFKRGIYIPLRKGTFLPPPNYQEMWNNKDIKRIIFNNITSSNKRRLRKLLDKQLKVNESKEYILSIPKPNGNNILIGLQYCRFKKMNSNKKLLSNPLKKAECNFDINPIYVERHDKGLLIPRGGGNNNIASKKIAVIGCGAVGGHIAMELIKTGIIQITLIDDDLFYQSNTYRHILGINAVLKKSNKEYKNEYKVDALKNEIESKLPYAKVDTITMKVEDIILSERVNFANYDLVIMAIGNPTIELFVNKYFHEKTNMPPLIITWLEPYGIGGHAFLTNNISKGCFNCLFDSPLNDNEDMFNRASFAEAGQTFSKSISGCGSLFIPYSSLDAIQTAILATRLAVNVLQGNEEDNPLLSWKGDPMEYIKNGYKLSARFNLSEQLMYELRYKYKSESCCICSKGEKYD